MLHKKLEKIKYDRCITKYSTSSLGNGTLGLASIGGLKCLWLLQVSQNISKIRRIF